MSYYALGLIETNGLVGAIEAADAASKAASVVVAAAELTPEALMTIKIQGELGAVQAAVEAGAQAAERIGTLVAAHVIPNPNDEIENIYSVRRYESKYHPDDNRPPLTLDKPSAPQSPKKQKPAKTKSKRVIGQAGPVVNLEQVDDLSAMTVSELRKFARGLTRLELKGREISKANKKQLMDAIRRVLDMD